MSHYDEIPSWAVIFLLLILFIGLAYVNHLCEPEAEGREINKNYCKEKTK